MLTIPDFHNVTVTLPQYKGSFVARFANRRLYAAEQVVNGRKTTLSQKRNPKVFAALKAFRPKERLRGSLSMLPTFETGHGKTPVARQLIRAK